MQESTLDGRRSRKLVAERLCPRQLLKAQQRRNLDQGKRVACGSEQELLDHLWRDRQCGATGKQRLRGVAIERGQTKLRQLGKVEHRWRSVAYRKKERDAVGVEPPFSEEQSFHRRAIERLSLVHDHEYWLTFGRGA